MTEPVETPGHDTPRGRQIAEDIARISTSLKDVAETDVPRLNERIFVGVFLPLFAGDENRAYPVTLDRWLTVAGGPYQSVDVIDAQNKVLFRVPPLFNRNAVNPVSTERDVHKIAHVIKSAQQLTNWVPAQGEAYLNKELTQRAMVMKVPQNVLTDIAVWNTIFRRYGRDAIMPLPDESETNSVVDKGPVYDDLEPL